MKKYIAAVSGGPDSMAMLNMYKNNIEAVCHVNYHKRKDSNNDENIVRNFCNQNNIKLYVKNVDKKDYKNNENFQSQARHIRYNFFEEISNILNIKEIIIAHNQDDYMETALMQINKKSKSLYYGIRKRNNYKSLLIYRPLLKIPKNKLMKYCDDNNIQYAIDSSNSSDIYERNRMRKEISKWSTIKRNVFLFNVKFYNFKHYFFRKKIDKKYNKWNNDLEYFLKQNKKTKYYILYKFLQDNNIIDNSSDKIKNIIKFIEKKSDKKFILKDDKYILIRKHIIQIKEK